MIAGSIGSGDELVGWRWSVLARCACIRLSTQRRHRSARDLGTAVQKALNLLGVVDAPASRSTASPPLSKSAESKQTDCRTLTIHI